MKLNSLTRNSLVSLAKKAASEERKAQAFFIKVLKEIARRKLYLEMGYGSLFAFVEKELGYSGGSASRRVRAVQAALDLEKADQGLENKLEKGTVTLTTLARVGQMLKREKYEGGRKISVDEKREILGAVAGQSEREVEKTLTDFATVPPAPARPREEVVSRSETLIHLRVNEAFYQEIEELKLLLSHVNPTMDTHEALRYVVQDYLKRKSPMRAVKKTRVAKSTPLGGKRASRPLGGTSTPPRIATDTLRRQVFRVWKHQCAYRDPVGGKRCQNRYQLEVDHIRPFAAGGATRVENLRPLCKQHHRYIWKTQQQKLLLPPGK